MSLNFYGRIKQYVDSDKNIVIQVVTDDLTEEIVKLEAEK